MVIGLLSDTHDRLPAIAAALEVFRARGIETLIHAGDLVAPFAARLLRAWSGELHVIYGNNDGERAGLRAVLPQIQDGPLFVERGGRRILVHHFLDWCDPADVARADIVVTGHTHEAGAQRRDGKLFVNPGECCGWVTGRCSAAALNLETQEVEWIELRP